MCAVRATSGVRELGAGADVRGPGGRPTRLPGPIAGGAPTPAPRAGPSLPDQSTKASCCSLLHLRSTDGPNGWSRPYKCRIRSVADTQVPSGALSRWAMMGSATNRLLRMSDLLLIPLGGRSLTDYIDVLRTGLAIYGAIKAVTELGEKGVALFSELRWP